MKSLVNNTTIYKENLLDNGKVLRWLFPILEMPMGNINDLHDFV